MTSLVRSLGPQFFDTSREPPRLVVGRCTACDRVHFPVADSCPWCGSESCTQDRAGSWGRLWLWTTVAVRPPGYRGPVPFGLGVVELEDVPLRVVTRIAVPAGRPLHEGQRMRLVAEDFPLEEGDQVMRTWTFAPATEA